MSIPLKQRMEKEPKYLNSGNASNWLKLDIGTHHLRLAPHWSMDEDELPYVRIQQHFGFKTIDDKMKAPICWDYITTNEEVATALYERDVIDEENFNKARKYGCPMCKIADALIQKRSKKSKAEQKLDDDYQKFQVRSGYLFNVIDCETGIPYMRSFSRTFFDQVKDNLTDKPNIFSPKKGHDFTLSASGKGLNRKYGAPIFVSEQTPLRLAKNCKLHDLYDALAYGVMPYDSVVDLCRINHSEIVKRSGISLTSFSSAPSSKDTKKKK